MPRRRWRAENTNLNKRTFIKLASAMAVSPLLSRAFARAVDHKLTNWAGNLEYGTERSYSALSLEVVQCFVRVKNKFKVWGPRHCFNEIANSVTQFLSLKSQDKIVALDAGEQTVTIESGMSY